MRTILLACCALACHAAPIHVGGSIGPAGITLQGVGDDSWFSLASSLTQTDIYDQFNPQSPYPNLTMIGVSLRPGTVCWPNCVPFVNGSLTFAGTGLYSIMIVANTVPPNTPTSTNPPYTTNLTVYSDFVTRANVSSPVVLTAVPEPGTWLSVLLPLAALGLAGRSRKRA